MVHLRQLETTFLIFSSRYPESEVPDLGSMDALAVPLTCRCDHFGVSCPYSSVPSILVYLCVTFHGAGTLSIKDSSRLSSLSHSNIAEDCP